MSCAVERHCNRSQAHRVCLAPPPQFVGLAPGPTAAAVVTRHELWKKHVISRDTHTHTHIHTHTHKLKHTHKLHRVITSASPLFK